MLLSGAAGNGVASLGAAQQEGVPRAAGDPDSGREAYFPGPGDDWERRRPAEVGMDSAVLAAAVRFAIENESPFGYIVAEWGDTDRVDMPS